MKLKELKDLIHTDLILVKDRMKIRDVWCYSEQFRIFEDCEVLGIRAEDDYVSVHIK